MAKSKKVSKSSSKTSTQSASSSASTEAVAEAVPQTTVPTMNDQFNALLATLSSLRSQIASVTSQVRALSNVMIVRLSLPRRTDAESVRQPTVPKWICHPLLSVSSLPIPPKPKGTEMARTDVTREINSYIREHKLQDPSNRRRILPDSKLKKLLNLKAEDELTYFNLQRYMSPHFKNFQQTFLQ